jgi:PKD repeat protein
VGETITFTNTSSNASSYSWDFGDGSTSTAGNPVHSYAAEGIYTVQLTATGPGGVHSVSHNVTIIPAVPVNIYAGQSVMNIYLGQTWGVISSLLNDWQYETYFNVSLGGTAYIWHEVRSPSVDVELYLRSIQTSTTLAAEDICLQINCRENFIGQTENGIMIGSAKTDVESQYGLPENHDTEKDNYWYTSLGIGFGFDASSHVDAIYVYDYTLKKRATIIKEISEEAGQKSPDIPYQ